MRIVRISSSNRRRTDKVWKGIIIHSMGEFVNGYFASCFLESMAQSAHYLITPESLVIEMVDPSDQLRVAYHAGISRWGNDTNLNQCYIGIELLLAGNYTADSFRRVMLSNEDPFGMGMYKTLASLIVKLKRQFDTINIWENILGHSSVSGTAVRPGNPKIDPGRGFNWLLLRSTILSYSQQINSGGML